MVSIRAGVQATIKGIAVLWDYRSVDAFDFACGGCRIRRVDRSEASAELIWLVCPAIRQSTQFFITALAALLILASTISLILRKT
jgi:hypothetical protein